MQVVQSEGACHDVKDAMAWVKKGYRDVKYALAWGKKKER